MVLKVVSKSFCTNANDLGLVFMSEFYIFPIDTYSPNRFTCEGFLLLLKGCMLGPHDFEFVSGLVSGRMISVSSGCSQCSGRMILYLSPICIPFVSQLSPSNLWMLSVLWPHDFTLVSHLSPICLPVSSGCSQCFFHLSPICFPLVSQ